MQIGFALEYLGGYFRSVRTEIRQDNGGKEGEEELEGDGRRASDQVAFGKCEKEEPRNAEQIESFEARKNYS